MRVTLTPELEEIVNQKVACGEYLSVDDLVNTVLEQALRQEPSDPYPPEEMRRLLAPAVEEFERGEISPLDMEAIIARAREQYAQKNAEA